MKLISFKIVRVLSIAFAIWIFFALRPNPSLAESFFCAWGGSTSPNSCSPYSGTCECGDDCQFAGPFCTQKTDCNSCANNSIDCDGFSIGSFDCNLLEDLTETPPPLPPCASLPEGCCWGASETECNAYLAFSCPCSPPDANCCTDGDLCQEIDTDNFSVCENDLQCQQDWDGSDGSKGDCFDMLDGCQISQEGVGCSPLPWEDNKTYQDPTLGCPGGGNTKYIYTAIGCIPVSGGQEFTEWVLRWAMGIAGGIAFILMIYSGFLIMTSAGNPKQVAAGKELLTAAISGLVLIIFSAYLLNLIGVKILHIL